MKKKREKVKKRKAKAVARNRVFIVGSTQS